jgi:hypothetical protein
MRGVYPFVWVSNIFFITLMMTMLHFGGEKPFFMKGIMRAESADELTRRVGNFVRPTIKKFLKQLAKMSLQIRRIGHKSIPDQSFLNADREIYCTQCCGSGMFIPDPNFFHPDPHQRIYVF